MKSENKKPIPRFRTVEEEARFWDSHDTTEYDFAEAPEVEIALPPCLPDVPGKVPVAVLKFKVGRNGSIIIPAAMRRRYRLQEGSEVGCVMYRAAPAKR